MVLEQLYFDKTNKRLVLFLLALFIFQAILIFNSYALSFIIIPCTLLLLFIYRHTLINLLDNKSVSKVGIASYSIYLLHQNIGVPTINKLSHLFNDLNWMLGILILSLLYLFGIYIYKYLEVPFGKKIKALFFIKTH
ncbi:hypothetical protein SAMN05444395_10574 [Flavobacterium fryxellicola]|nr:hypothetical protein SAMN05444395_10574 [Flavobacterium fryxellicola]